MHAKWSKNQNAAEYWSKRLKIRLFYCYGTMLFGRTKIFFTFNNVCFLDLYPNIIMPTCFNCSLKSKMAAHQRIRQYVSDIANRSFQDIHGEDMACFPIFRYTHTYSQQQAKISTIYFSYPLKAIGLIAESSKNSLVRERLNFNIYDVLQCLTSHKGSREMCFVHHVLTIASHFDL